MENFKLIKELTFLYFITYGFNYGYIFFFNEVTLELP